MALASTDCVVRSHLVARPGIESLEELRGKRIGISLLRATSGFALLKLAERMGWDPDQDISIMLNGSAYSGLQDGTVDALVAAERRYAEAKRDGLPILVDMSEWSQPLAGNSILVTEDWLEDPMNREAARRFLMALVEGIALFHQDRELALEILGRWNGVTDREYAETMYEGGRWIPREAFPCYEGIAATLELYDSHEMRRYAAEDFYDDTILKEIVESGFVDALYR
jgi:ABC-type nitrate/sulfonate/bicarbonate transport system substrate-binding protein